MQQQYTNRPIMVEDSGDRSIWQSIKQMFNTMADTMTYTNHAISTVALVGDTLAGTGLIMAESNSRIVGLHVQGKEERRTQELYKEFPQLDPDFKPPRASAAKKK